MILLARALHFTVLFALTAELRERRISALTE
jgi:hypothetical protein